MVIAAFKRNIFFTENIFSSEKEVIYADKAVEKKS
jgi:hypothetical protein